MHDRFENVNLLRALAAMAVVVYHVIEYAKWTSFPGGGPLVAFRIGWIGVDLFYVISGFVITRSALALWRRDPAAFAPQYWARRLARIVPLYVLTGALWVAFFKPDFFAPPATRWLWQIGAHLTFTHTFWPFTYSSIDGVNWTLAIEMQFYLVVALLIPWIARTPGWRLWLACILVAWTWRATVVWFFGHYEPVRLFMRIMQLPGTIDEFGAGIFLAKLLDHRVAPRLRDGTIWALAAIATGVACMAVYWANTSYWDQPAMLIFWRTSLGAFFACVVAAAAYLPTFARTWPLRPVRYLGEVSYGIYLWHLFAIEFCLRIPGMTPPGMLAATLVLTIAAAAISWHLFEKPILAYGHRWRGKSVSGLRPATPGDG
jgi:peptidoglycan/LPS O-acetylase OafA/YrhL